jgi:cytidine deaminase
MISKYHETGYSCKKNACSLLKISVGVAILLDNEKIVLAQIKENAAYPSGLCAERVAISSRCNLSSS